MTLTRRLFTTTIARSTQPIVLPLRSIFRAHALVFAESAPQRLGRRLYLCSLTYVALVARISAGSQRSLVAFSTFHVICVDAGAVRVDNTPHQKEAGVLVGNPAGELPYLSYTSAVVVAVFFLRTPHVRYASPPSSRTLLQYEFAVRTARCVNSSKSSTLCRRRGQET